MKISSVIMRIENEGLLDASRYYVRRAIELKGGKRVEQEPVDDQSQRRKKYIIFCF